MENYRPIEPYVIQSGKHKGKSLELLMFQNYSMLKWLLGKLNKEKPDNKNHMHQQLEWLIQQGENRSATMLCPQCKERPVKFFSSLGNDRYGYSIYPIYTCCESDDCRTKLFYQASGSSPIFYPIKFSSILNYRKKFDRDMAVKLLRSVYRLPGRLTAKIAFEFFRE